MTDDNATAEHAMSGKRTKLSAWDLAILEKLMDCAVNGRTATFERIMATEFNGEAYGNSLRDLHARLVKATRGSLTEV